VPTNRREIPVCRSEFLQDLTIALGRRSLKSLRHKNSTLDFDATEEEIDGVSSERLDIAARTRSGSLTKITIWEDGISWVYFRQSHSKSSPSQTFEMHANLTGMGIEDMANLVRATLSDFESTRQVWERRAITN
jgi:hypothetical protein